MVREGTTEDAHGIATVHVRAWRAAYQGFMPAQLLDGLSVTHRENTWRAALAGGGPLAVILVAEAPDGTVGGFCAIALPSRDEEAGKRTAEVAATHVDPAHWHTGFGRELLESALGRLDRAEWDEATLWVFQRNAQARAFYARFGFRLDGAKSRHEASGATEVRMRTALSPL